MGFEFWVLSFEFWFFLTGFQDLQDFFGSVFS